MISEFLLVGPKKIGVMSELVIRKKAAHPLDALAFHELNPLMYLVVEVSRSRSPKYDRFILPSSGKFVHFLTVASQNFKRSHFYSHHAIALSPMGVTNGSIPMPQRDDMRAICRWGTADL